MAVAQVDEENYRSAILHRREQRHSEPLSKPVQWLLEQCSNSRSTHDPPLFTPLPPNPDILPLDRQTYQQWKAHYEMQKFIHPRRMRRRSILLQPLSYSSDNYAMASIESEVLTRLQQFCTAFFMNTDITISDQVDVSQLRNITKRVHSETGREQLLINDLMKYLKVHKRRAVLCVVGVTIVDLYPGPEWNFSLGHASLTEGVAVCSFGRYFNSQVTTAATNLSQQIDHIWVLIKVVTHEMCHVFGLSHCYYFNCCMNESSSIEAATTQPLFLCPVCLRKLHKVLCFDLAERYKAMALQCMELHKVMCQSCDHTADSDNSSSRFLDAFKWLVNCLDNFK